MAKIVKRSFDAPEEIRSVHKGKIEAVDLGGVEIRRVIHEPGWRWSECAKPTVGTDSCQVGHLIHVLSGRILVRMDDGSEAEFGPGDVGSIPPGHDAWTLGDEPFISIDFGDAQYTRRNAESPQSRFHPCRAKKAASAPLSQHETVHRRCDPSPPKLRHYLTPAP